MEVISVHGAQEHNLKNIDIDIPKNALVVVTGISGSGKSSLVFDTLYAEAFRRFADASGVPLYLMGHSSWSKLSRPRFRSITGLPPALGLSQRQGVAGKTSTVGTISGVSDLLRVYYAAFGDVYCRKCDIPLRAIAFPDLLKKILSEFHAQKMMIIAPVAEKRKGAFVSEIEKFRELGFSKLRVNGDIFDLQDEDIKIKIDAKKLNTIDVIIDYVTLSQERKQRVERALLQALEYGRGVVKLEPGEKKSENNMLANVSYKYNTQSSCPQCGESAPKLDPRYFSHSSLGQCSGCAGSGAQKDNFPADLFPCETCHGTRLDPSRPTVRICKKTFEEIHLMKIETLFKFISTEIKTHAQGDKARNKVYAELLNAVRSITRLSLSHLILNRSGASLSPGDLQRLRLASMIANKLTGVLYVLDEPCQGLNVEEVNKVVCVLKEIVAEGASIIAVEHHPAFLAASDFMIIMGPQAGIHGGKIVSTQ